MKKIYLGIIGAALMAICSSCKTSSYVKWFSTDISVVDYYSAGLDGKVFITEANSVSFEYTPLGSIYLYQSDGYVAENTTVTTTKTKVEGDPIYGGSETKEVKKVKGEYKRATYATALRAASEAAVAMGGDGIINLKLSIRESSSLPGTYYPSVEGMVIKRK